MRQVVVRFNIDGRGFPTGHGKVKLTPARLSMGEYREMTRRALRTLTRVKTGHLFLEIHRKRKGPKLFVDLWDGGSDLVYVTSDLVTAARSDDDVTFKTLAATAFLAVQTLAQQHFPDLLDAS